MGNLIETGVADRLIDAHYLHSNTKNFINVAKQHRESLKGQNNETLMDIKLRLERFLNESNAQINSFYEDLSNYYLSINQPEKVIRGRDSYKDGVYTPNGANEFSRKFLIDRKNKNNGIVTDEKIILSIINSQESIDAIREAYEKVAVNAMNKTLKIDNEQRKIFEELEKLFKAKLPVKIEELTFNTIDRYLKNLFVKNRKDGQFGLSIKSTKKSKKKDISKELRDFIKTLGIEDFSPRNAESLKHLKNTLNQKLRDKNLYFLVGKEYWNFLNTKFKEKTNRSLHGAKSTKFANYFSNAMMAYTNINLVETNQEQSLKGFVLEFGLFASVNLPIYASERVANLLGQTNVNRTYITEVLDENLNIQQTEKIIQGQSPSDIEYVGKSGKRYRFQLKNNFNDVKSHLSFRSQAQIKVSTYVPTALNGFSENVKDILVYMLINTAFLRKYGLGPYGHNEEVRFNPTDYPDVRDYVLFFLQQTFQFLVGYQYDKKIRTKDGITEGNIAYVFQGKYLIPVAAYFYSALEMINKILNSEHELQGIGGIAGLPSFKNFKLSIPEEEFQRRKNKIVGKLIESKNLVRKSLKYPQELVGYGGKYGLELYDKLSFDKISIILEMKKLERYFK